MNYGKYASFALLVLLGLLMEPALMAEEADDELQGEVVVGEQYWVDSDNRDSAKFEEYRDVPNGFVAGRFLLSWKPKPGWFFDLDAIDVSQNDQRIHVEFGQVDRWHGIVRWAENPRAWTDQAFMLFTPSAPGVFTLEDSFQAAVRAATGSSLPAGDANGDGEWDPGTKGFVIDNAIGASAAAVDLGHQRERGGLELQFTPTRNWTFRVSGDRERRRGTTPQSLGQTFSLAPAEVAAPLDYRTDDARAAVEYVARDFHVGLELSSSDFQNANPSLTWDNQLFLVDEPGSNANSANPAHGRLTFGTDNRMTRWAVRGGLNLPARTRLDASISVSETTQDDAFLPMTINSLLVPSALPASSFDGEYETTTAQVRLSGRPGRTVRWGAWWRAYELDNRSPSLTFQDNVTTDASFALCGNVNLPCDLNGNDVLDDRLPRRNLPYGYQRENLGGLIGWRPWDWFEGALTVEREDLEREFSAVEESSETSYKLNLDFDVSSWLWLRATARRQEREADEYHAHYYEDSFPAGEPYVAAFNEGTRRFAWTDRDRDSYALMFDVTLNERWGLYAEATYYDDLYFDPETGLEIGRSFSVQEDRNFDGTDETYDILLAGRTENSGDAYALGVSYVAGRRFDVYADYTLESFEYALASRYRNVSGGVGTDDPLDNWSSAADDDYDTATVGFNCAIDEERTWTLHGDLSYSKGTSRITTAFVPGGAPSGDTTLTAFPEVDATLEYAVLALRHHVRKNLDYSLSYWYESWEEDNFASDFNEPYMGEPDEDPGAANWILLGMDYRNYENHILSLMLRYTY